MTNNYMYPAEQQEYTQLPPLTPSMEELIKILGIEIKKGNNKHSINAKCPFCGDTKYHLSISPQKWVCHCWKCGFGGNGVQLYAEVRGISVKEATAELSEKYGVDGSVYAQIEKRAKTIISTPEPELDYNKIDKVYRALYSILRLSSEHKQNLINRGMTVKHSHYKTLPQKSYLKYNSDIPNLSDQQKLGYNIAQKLIELGMDLSGVPGFYTIKGKWFMVYHPGMLVPVIDENGLVVCLQIRTDEGDLRYITLSSSGLENGTKACTNIHIVGKVKKDSIICITEGPLKADIAACLSIKNNPKIVYVAIMGVNNTKKLYKYLQDLFHQFGPLRVENCLYMDK